jgi:glycyl-tRNA synthetase beta subunit
MSVHKKVWVVLSSEDDIAKFKEERLLPPGICVFTPESLTRMVGHKAVNWQRMCLTDMYERPIESVTLLVDHSVLENMYETVIRHMHRYDDPTEFYVSPTKTLDLFDTSTL